MTGQQEHELLRNRLNSLLPYPAGVIPVPQAIPGTAFFPGGDGLFKDKCIPEFPVGGIMILGHDFHSETGYAASLKRGEERLSDPTWRNLVALLGEASIEPESCFFTNFYMGLRAGNATTGVFPGAKDKSFVQRCRDFFLFQLRLQKPRAVLVLGKHVPPLLAPLAPQLTPWAKAKSLLAIDAADAAVITNVRFADDLAPTNMVVLTHPSLRHANLKRRHYKGFSAQEAELAMMGAVLDGEQ